MLSSIGKKSKVSLNLLILFFLIVSSSFSQDTVKVVTYNLLRFNGDTDRNVYFKKIIDELSADIYITQELSNNSGVSNFLNNILNHGGQNKFIMVYRLKHIETDKLFYVFNMHLKARQGSSNQIRRETQVISLMDYTKQMNNDHFYIAAGDFNIYSTDEPAYRKFFEETSTGYGKFNDLITVEGKYNNEEFAYVHTQSPRTTQFGGGASGGLDDRFDYILFSDSLITSKKNFVLKNSYNVLGNDGKHYNMAINELPNLSVSQDIADALHNASDHLPVSVEIIFSNDIVDPVNTAPIVNDTIFNIDEFPNDGILVGQIVSQDLENDSLSYSIISGNDQNIFFINDEGNVIVSDGELKSNLQLTINVIESPPLSVDVSYINSIKLSPNPFEETLNINFDNLNYKKFTVMSLEGKIIKKESISKKSYKLNFSDKPDGIYIFLAESSNRKSVIRIIKKGS